MMRRFTNSVAGIALAALVLAPGVTVGTFMVADTAHAAGKSDDRGSREKKERNNERSSKSQGKNENANAKGMEKKAAAQAKKALKVAALPPAATTSSAPLTSPLPAPRPNRGTFASEWKALNAMWANGKAFENASDNSRLARIKDYYDELVSFNELQARADEIEAILAYEGPSSGELDGTIAEKLLVLDTLVEGTDDFNILADEIEALEAQRKLALAKEANATIEYSVILEDGSEETATTTVLEQELAGIDEGAAAADLQAALEAAAGPNTPPSGEALEAFNSALLAKFPVVAAEGDGDL